MKNFSELIKEKIVIFDGAFGTMLEASGVKTGTVPEMLVLTDPEPVKAIHRAYAEAGADVISTDTFGANILKAGEKSDDMYELIGIKKDAPKRPSGFEFRPFGFGLQNAPNILDASVKAGASWVVVEQDQPSMGKTPLECAKLSRDYLKLLGW